MNVQRLSGMLLSGFLFVGGCATSPSKPATMTTSEKATQVRDEVTKLKPGSQVGDVVAVDATVMYAAVGNLPVADLKSGQIISFLDADGNPVNNGTIYKVDTDKQVAVVKYDPQGKRPPMAGDLALWTKE